MTWGADQKRLQPREQDPGRLDLPPTCLCLPADWMSVCLSVCLSLFRRQRSEMRGQIIALARLGDDIVAADPRLEPLT